MQAVIIVTIFGHEQEALTLILPLLVSHWEGMDPTCDYRSGGDLSWAILNPSPTTFSCDQSSVYAESWGSACDQDQGTV